MEGETSLALTHTLVRLPAPSFLFSTFLSFDQIRVNLLRSEDFLLTLEVSVLRNSLISILHTRPLHSIIILTKSLVKFYMKYSFFLRQYSKYVISKYVLIIGLFLMKYYLFIPYRLYGNMLW